MITEIVDILKKYQKEKWQNNIISNIFDCIEEITNLLKEIKTNLSQKLYEINLSEQLEDDEIIKNIQSDIKTIKQLIAYYDICSKSLDIKKTVNDYFFEKKIIYILSDLLCPFCNVKLSVFKIYYKKIINDKIDKRNISGYECPCCKKHFLMQSDIENIDFENTDVEPNYQYYISENQLTIFDVIVLSTLESCNNKGHNLKDITAKIPIFTENGKINFINKNVTYCKNCNKYIMLKFDFKQIKDIVACKVIDQTISKNINQNNDEIEIKQNESILYQYGYNVSEKDKISDKQRHLILASVIESNILTREQICSHLDTLIERGNKIEKWKIATQKWRQDRFFVKSYNVNNLPKILLNEVVLKYRKSN